MIETVVFDLGGVLVDWNPRYLFRKLMKDELEIEAFLSEVCTSDWNERQDEGRSLSEATEELVKLHPHREEHIRAYYGRWVETLGGPIQGTVEILEEIHRAKTHPLYALSNWSAETFPKARAMYPFLGLFKSVLLSGEEKMIKPNPKFYGLLTSRFGVVPERSIFIDDNARNIEAGRALGFVTHHFKSPELLRRHLEELGIIGRAR